LVVRERVTSSGIWLGVWQCRSLLSTLVVGLLAFAVAAAIGQTALARNADDAPAVPASAATIGEHGFVAQQVGRVPGTLFGLYGGYQAEADMARARQSGAQLMRIYVEWASLQPYQAYGDGSFLEPTSKARLDEQVRRVTAAGMTPVLLVGEAPDWAAPRPRGPLYPDKLIYYERFLSILVRAYMAPPFDVHYWELWPEPDAIDTIPEDIQARFGADILKRRAWGDHGAEYAAMLRAAYPAIKRIDPNATVLIGAIAYDWFGRNCPGFNCGGIFNYRFINDVIAAGGACCFDVLAFNDYAVFAPGWEQRAPGRDIAAKTNYLREQLRAMGVDKPMMVLEAGLWSIGSNVPKLLTTGEVVVAQPDPAIQATYVTKLYTRAASLGLLSVSWYTLRDFGYDEEKRGLLTESLDPKPAFWAYRIAADRLRGAFFAGLMPSTPVSGGPGELEGYEYLMRDGRKIAVAWVDGATDATIAIPVDVQPSVQRVMVYDSLGRVIGTLRPQGGRVVVRVGTTPLYIEEMPAASHQLALPVTAKLSPGR
jgi:hypothetical protein